MVLVPQHMFNEVMARQQQNPVPGYLSGMTQQSDQVRSSTVLSTDVKAALYDQLLQQLLSFREHNLNTPLKIQIQEEEKNVEKAPAHPIVFRSTHATKKKAARPRPRAPKPVVSAAQGTTGDEEEEEFHEAEELIPSTSKGKKYETLKQYDKQVTDRIIQNLPPRRQRLQASTWK